MAGPEGGVRLQKVLAASGVGSRRACEALIAAGRVDVNGSTVRTMGTRVDPASDVIRVDGKRVTPPETGLVHLVLNKPRGVVSTMSDPQGRPTLGDYVPDRSGTRLFHVGRLDADTEGLILLTNDGDLAHRLTHPSYEVAKTYLAEVTGPVPRGLGARLRAGVELDDGTVAVDDVRIAGRSGTRVMLEIVLHEGRKHVVRRLLDAFGHPVRRLVRTRIGPVVLGELRPGKTRPLSRDEVGALYREVGL
ncbi:MAG: pseudouridine synthase [Jiangellaceae bacterium]